MIRLFLSRLFVSGVAIACLGVMVWQLVDDRFIGGLPFLFEPHGEGYVLRAVDVPLPEPLAQGDIIDIRQMSVLERAALFPQEIYLSGASLTLRIRRDDKVKQVAVVLSAQTARSSLERFQEWAFLGPFLSLLAVGLLTLWRGRDAAAAWLCIFALGIVLDNGVERLMMSPLVSLWLEPLRLVLQTAYVGAVYGTAVSAARAGLPQAWRRACFFVVALFLSVGLAESATARVLQVFLGITVPQWAHNIFVAMFVGTFAISVLTLLVGYAHAQPESRGRMRWILLSTGLLTVSVLGNLVFERLNMPVLYAVSNTGLTGLSLFGYLYATLRTRIVDVTFVMDRALVYSVITAMMFGVFSLLEEAVHRLALGDQLGWIVQAAGALIVAAALNPLHRLLDRGLERVFFHKLRAMAAALRKLGKESAFFENEQALMARVLKQLRVPCASAAIYERSGAVYVLRSADGEGWPGAVDADDALFVTLRAGRQVLDLKGQDSAVGAHGLAFPMAIGQILTGAVVGRLREGEQLDSEVRAALAELAQSLGTSLYLLRYRELAALTLEISAGKLGPEAARSRATELAAAL